MSIYLKRFDAAYFNGRSPGHLPGLLGIHIVELGQDFIRAELPVRRELFVPNGFLHAGSVVTLADTACGYGCVAHLLDGVGGFTTLELKSKHLGTDRDSTIEVLARAAHLGRTTPVWDATVAHRETAKTIALFGCTQMVLWPK